MRVEDNNTDSLGFLFGILKAITWVLEATFSPENAALSVKKHLRD
jgi:hypothetical protein